MKALTTRQQEVYDLIREHISQTGMPPTRAEIAMRLGFRSPNAAEEHLKALARKGVIEIVSIGFADELREERAELLDCRDTLLGEEIGAAPAIFGLQRKGFMPPGQQVPHHPAQEMGVAMVPIGDERMSVEGKAHELTREFR